MRRRRKKQTLAAVVLTVFGLLVWQFTPLQAVVALGSLTDPEKVATLGERGANSRVNKIVFWMDAAQKRGLSGETAVSWAQALNGLTEPRASLVKQQLLRNLNIAGELGLLTDDNRARLKRGNAARATRGPYSGEIVEIDHVVPLSLAPELGNELANLEMLPETLNRRKSNRVTKQQLAHAEKFFEIGLLKKESLEHIRESAMD